MLLRQGLQWSVERGVGVPAFLSIGTPLLTNNLDCDPSIRRRRQTAAPIQR